MAPPQPAAVSLQVSGPIRRLRRTLSRRPVLGSTVLLISVLLVLQTCLAGLTTETAAGDKADDRSLPGTVLVLTAHPDDEVMFFGPSILALVGAGVRVFALCLSTGNADGLGSVRERELVNAYKVLGVPVQRVSSMDDPKLQDGMAPLWDPDHIVTRVEAYLEQLDTPVDAAITFDAIGVSSHPNHKACYQASQLLRERSAVSTIYALQSPSLATKYLSLLAAILDVLLARPLSGSARLATVGKGSNPPLPPLIRTLSSPRQYWQTIGAMREHASQLVWFRYFYIVLSKLMYANQLVRA